MSEPEEDVDERLEALDSRETELTKAAKFVSANRIAQEIRRVARAEQRLIPYLHATFTVMNGARDLLDPQAGKDAAIEIIGLLESDDQARKIQADLPEQAYEHTVHWMTPCGYDNLAMATACLQGYNSDGMHACIADGIQVCRRVGKLECIACFREYARNVYFAADDIDMAMHYTSAPVGTDKSSNNDRRWSVSNGLSKLYLQSGDLESAASEAERAFRHSQSWHSPYRAKLIAWNNLIEIAWLTGEPDRWAHLEPPSQPEPGEFPWYELRSAEVKALVACCQQQYDDAIDLLTSWDRKLTQKKCLDDWFSTRLRLLACHRMAGNHQLFERLADQFETKATAAREWIGLRKLKRLRDQTTPPTPLPACGDWNIGPFALSSLATSNHPRSSGTIESERERLDQENDTTKQPENDGDNSASTTATKPVDNGPPKIITEFWARLDSLEAERDDEPSEQPNATDERSDSFERLLLDIMSYKAADKPDEELAKWLVYSARYTIEDANRGAEVWDWANSLLALYPQSAVIINLVATLGVALKYGRNDEMDHLIDADKLERMFRKSLDLDPDRSMNFARAGDYFRFMENFGEAERCYARSFRLDRTNSEVAKKLARLYRQTDRSRDALNVLDIALRAGSKDPDVAWSAALNAHHLGQWEATITYLDAYEELFENQPWVNYYRASALLALDRAEEALESSSKEATNNPECPYPVAIHRAVALSMLDRNDEFRAELQAVFSLSLGDVDYLTIAGLRNLFRILWTPVSELPDSDPLRKEYESLVIAAGVAPDDMFDVYRSQREVEEDVNFYRCEIKQPLDRRWQEWPGRLAEEQEFKHYVVYWGVLAHSEEEAITAALEWQARAFPIAPEVIETIQSGEGYRDQIGVVWQGNREGEIE